MRRGADPEASAAMEVVNAKRASERAQLAAKPKNGWISDERFHQQARAEVVPIRQKRGPGRPRREADG